MVGDMTQQRRSLRGECPECRSRQRWGRRSPSGSPSGRFAATALAAAGLALFAPQARAVCGDGVLDGAEVCDVDPVRGGFQFNVTGLDCTDFGFDYGTLGCVDCLWSWADCRDGGYFQLCGNGRVEPYEQCDGGVNCSQTCTCRASHTAVCGNRCREGLEECDDGDGTNWAEGDTCGSDCRWHFYCGDGVQSPTEECDAGAWNSDSMPDTCRTDCLLPYCGDSVTDTGEECDEGRENSDLISDRCRTNCRNPRCGDSVIDVGRDEQCDRGAENADTPGAACNSVCLLPGCGNGYQEPWEVCDDDNTADGDGCSATCASDETCGNRIVDAAVGETCDDGNVVSGDGCRADCTLELCGDGRIDPFEICDDGGRADGDGCDARCAVEDGYTCEGEPSVCTAGPADAGTDAEAGPDADADVAPEAVADADVGSDADGEVAAEVGPDAGGDVAADVDPDAGTQPTTSGGCGCAAAGARGSGLLVLLLGCLAVARRRRLAQRRFHHRNP